VNRVAFFIHLFVFSLSSAGRSFIQNPKMHFQSFISMTLAVSALFSSGVLAMPHGHSHKNFHNSPLVPKYAHSSRDVEKRDAAMESLKSEAATFTSWMNGFVKNGTTSATAVSALQEEVSAHVDAVHSFVTNGKSSAGVSGNVLDQLSSDVDSFKVWIDTWAQGTSYVSSTDAINQLSDEMVQYSGWLNSLIGTSTPATPPSGSDSGSGSPTTDITTTVQQTSTTTVVSAVTFTGTPPVISLPSSAPAASSSSEAAAPVASPPANNPVTTPVTSTPTTSAASKPSSPPPPPKSNGSPKLAAWWGQSAASSAHSLNEICNDDSFDIVMLSFLNNFFSGGGMPTLNLGPATGAPSAAQSAAGATGLFSGSSLIPAIQACQSSGKKVMLTLGGAAGYSQSAFTDDNQASEFAETLWNLFLGGSSALRPFGSIKLDGIDVDNENKDQTGYTAFVSALRGKFSGDSSKEYLISAAPQCPRPDASIPLDAMKQMDIVWVQFYNNPSCNHGTSGFIDSVKAWSDDLAGSNAKLYIGAIADVSQGSGFIDTASLASEVSNVQSLNLPNYGGYALWDAALAAQNGNMQNSIKSALA
jgi:chitinase